MGICASKPDNRSGTRKGGRNTKGKKNPRNARAAAKQRRRRETSSDEQTSSSSENEDRNSLNSDNETKPGTGGQIAINSKPMAVSTRIVDNNAYPPVPQEDMDILFYKSVVCTSFKQVQVPPELLRTAMKLALLAPSAYNCCPMRVVFILGGDPNSRVRLETTLQNLPEISLQCQSSPCVAVVCTDKLYTRNLPKLMPYVPNAQQMFEQYDDLNEMIRIRNSNLQAGYLVLALRSLGLGVGAINGFENTVFDEEFLEGTSWKSNLLITFVYPLDRSQQPPSPTPLTFDAAAKLLN
jgi:3-hydroxypropanoate dehydrogenase